MTIILVGLNHRTAPVELREKLALTGCAQQMALDALRNQTAQSDLQEGVILSTCNRLEIYATVDHSQTGWQRIERFLAHLQNIPLQELQPHLYFLEGDPAIQHLMRVACGLDSMILGEPQILGQVTQAYNDAQRAHFTGPVLSHLLMQAIHTGKRARSETDISRFTTSVSHAGALLVLDKLEQTATPHILVVGAGEMAVLAAQSLKNLGFSNITFINRTYNRAEALADEVGGQAMSWYQLGEALNWADAVITATGAPHTVIYKKEVQQELDVRQGRPLLFVDIAVPRDVEVSVGELPGVQRYDIDDLQSIVDANTAQRQAQIPKVEAIIAEEMGAFHAWHTSRQVSPVIQDLRRWANEVAQQEVQQALKRLPSADDRTAQIVARLAHRLINKLLHEPTVRLRDQASDGNGFGYAQAIVELFGLHHIDCALEQDICYSNGNGRTAAMPCNLQCIAQEK